LPRAFQLRRELRAAEAEEKARVENGNGHRGPAEDKLPGEKQ
jgi:hypothetical protein